MDSDNPNRPEGSYDQQAGQPSGSTPPGQPTGAYPPPPAPQQPYSQPHPQQQPTQPYGVPPAQGGYSQPPQYSDRPGSQPAQPQYSDRPASQPPQGGYYPPQQGDQPQYPPQGQYPPQQPTGDYRPQQQYYNPGPGSGGPGGMTPPPNQVNAPKKSNNGMIFGIAGILVLVIVAVGAYFAFFNKGGSNPLNPDNGNTAMSAREASAANVLPSNSLAYISVATNLDGSQKAAFDKLSEAFQSQPGFKDMLDQLTQQAMGSTGSTGGQMNEMSQEIQGLITKYTKQISIGILPPSTADWAAIQSGGQAAIADVATRNLAVVADMDLASLKKDATQSEVAETSNGVEISRIVSGTLVLYAAPLDGSNVAVGLRAEPVRVLIDQMKNGSGSVKADETYKFLSGAVPADRVASFYLNLTEIAKQVEAVAPGQLTQAGITGLSGAFLLTISGQDDGMQIDLASQADVKSNFTNQITSTGKPDSATFNDVPTDALGFYAGTDLKTLIKSALDSLSASSQSTGGQDMVAQVEAQVQQMTGLSLQNDIIPLLGGDYVLSISATGTTNPTGTVLFQLKMNDGDRDKAANALDKVMQAVAQGQATTFDAAGGKFYDLSAMGMKGLAVGVTSDRLMVVFEQTGDAQSKVGEVSGSLGKGFGTTAKWTAAKAHLPADSNAIIYVDIQQIVSIFGSSIPAEAQPAIAPFKYVIIGSAVQAAPGSSTPNRSLSRIFIGISK